MTRRGRAQSLLRRPGRRPLTGGARQRPPVMRRGMLLLASGLAAAMFAPHAAADPTATTPAPDPNPPPGAAPDPYSPAPATPAPKKAPTRTPAPAPVVHHVYSPPATPVHVASTPSSTRTYTRPTHTRVTHPKRKAAPARHRHRRHVQHKRKPPVVRVTPRLQSYVVSFVNSLSATVVDPGRGDGAGRRRAAGFALAALCAASLSLVLLAARSRRNLVS